MRTPAQLTLDRVPEPAVAVSSTYHRRGRFLDREGNPQAGGYVLTVGELPHLGAARHGEQEALECLLNEVRAYLRGLVDTDTGVVRMLRDADREGRLAEVLRAGLAEPVLADEDEPWASRPRRSKAERRRALALEDMWRPDASCSSRLPRSERARCVSLGDFLRLHLRMAQRTFRRARAAGAPVCCSWHDGWDTFMDWPGSGVRAKQLDARSLGWPPPCGVLHAGDSKLSLSARARGIASFHWLYLRPGKRGRAFREQTMFDGPLGPPRVRRPMDAWLAGLCRLLGQRNPGLARFVERVTR